MPNTDGPNATGFERTTEQDSPYDDLEHLPVAALLQAINTEDQKVPQVVHGCIAQIAALAQAVADNMQNGGRLFYLGSGTSGRLGIVDASECPPTFGVAHGVVVGIIAGGDGAIRKAVEFAEDDTTQGWKDLQAHALTPQDCIVGISASGTTPYVLGAVTAAKQTGNVTGCITCNAGSPLAKAVHYPIEAIVGPEVITGSTRMKAGTAQKLILNMLSTSVMVQLGHVQGNKMVDMTPTNAKLIDRGTRYIMRATGAAYDAAKQLLLQHGSVRAAVAAFKQSR
jgi:N-acetylmuramic acid 6-phosphate etherase